MARTISIGILALFLTGCPDVREVPPYYFLMAPVLREGGDRPTTPQNLRVEYQVHLRQVYLQWEESIDPDFNIPVGVYRVYVYPQGPPQEYYRIQDLLAETNFPFYALSSNPFTGTLYFAVTAFDGGVESLPSNTAQLNVLE